MDRPVEQLIDEILVMDCQSGSVKALEALVSRWQKRLWQYAYKLTGNTEGAWDVTQESWFGIIRGLNKLDDPTCFKTWAYRIVTNKSRDWRKEQIKKRQPPDEFEICCNKDQTAESKDNKSDIETIMSRLPIECRTVLTLYYLDELSVPNISDVLNVPQGTVKSRLYTARKEFKRIWQKNFIKEREK